MFGLRNLFGKSEQPTQPVENVRQEKLAPTTRDELLADTKKASAFFNKPNDIGSVEGKEQFLASGPTWLVEMATEGPFDAQFFLKDIVEAIITVAETSQATRPEEIKIADVQNLLKERLDRKTITALGSDDNNLAPDKAQMRVFDAIEDNEQ